MLCRIRPVVKALGAVVLLVFWTWLAIRLWHGLPLPFFEYLGVVGALLSALVFLAIFGWLFFPREAAQTAHELGEAGKQGEITPQVARQRGASFWPLFNRCRRTVGYALVIGFGLFCAHGMLKAMLTGGREHQHRIERMEPAEGGVVLHLSNGTRCLVSCEQTPYNRRNLMLLYEGKLVWVAEMRGEALRVTPVTEDGLPILTDEEYRALIDQGFTDSDIKYSFRIPPGRRNPNREPRTYGGTVSYGAPGVEGRKLQ